MSSLKIAAVCTLREAAAFKAQLLEQLDAGGDVGIDAGAVDKIDTAGLQLLAAFARKLASEGRGLSWSATTAELHKAAAQVGLLEALQLPAEEPQP
jgi:anti-anti-sigma regulatory factor